MAANTIVQAVLFDAYGTLVELDDPVGRLGRGLAEAGYANDADVVAAAFGQEVAYYRRHQDLGGDPTGLAALRTRCAAVFAGALTSPPPADVAATVLLGALTFRVFADVTPALDLLEASGVRLAVVSNWDASLPDVLAEVGLLDRFASVSASAVVGVRKPDPAIFHHALARLRLDPEQIVHVGDSVELDVAGAAAAGIRPLLIDRGAGGGAGRNQAMTSLVELPGRLGLE